MKRPLNTGKIKANRYNYLPVVFITVIMVIVQISVDTGIIQRYLLPSPTDVLKTLYIEMPEILPHLAHTLTMSFWGLLISIIIGISLALFMDNFISVRKAIFPVLIITQNVPTIALAPLLVLWFGYGQVPKLILVVLTCFFPLTISISEGLLSVDNDMINLFKSMNATKFQVLRYVKIPSAASSFFSGLKIALTYCVSAVVVAEWMGSDKGLGVYMLRVKRSYSYDKMFASILIIVVISIVLVKICDHILKRTRKE